MPGTLQTNHALEFGFFDHCVPIPKGNRHYQTIDDLKVSCYVGRLAADGQLVGIFQNKWQQLCRWLTAKDRATITSGEQCRDSPDMVEMHVSDHQGLDTLHCKIGRQRTRP